MVLGHSVARIISIGAAAWKEIVVRPLFVKTVFAMLSSAVEISSFFRLRKRVFYFETQLVVFLEKKLRDKFPDQMADFLPFENEMFCVIGSFMHHNGNLHCTLKYYAFFLNAEHRPRRWNTFSLC